MENEKCIFISWQPYCSRSDNIAREFNGNSYKIYYGIFGSRYSTILFKYIFQFFKTFLILFKEKPDIVFVMSPPVFACIPVYIYCNLFSKKYIIDMHTGAMVDSIWKNAAFLQSFFCRNAIFSIVTNDGIGRILKRWNSRYIIVPDVPIKHDRIASQNLAGKLNVTLVNTYSKDEPLREFIAAIRGINDTHFYITGKIKKASGDNAYCAESNVHFTDFLPDAEYYGLLKCSDLIVALTTRDKTMQRGAYEAIYLGKPVVTSNWKILKEHFPVGSVLVDNTEDDIRRGIKLALKSLRKLNSEAILLKNQKESKWKYNFNKMKVIIRE